MKIGIGPYYLRRYGNDAGAKLMAEHGYEYIDFDLTDTESEYYTAKEEFFFTTVNKIRRTLNENDIKINQIHGPWRYPPNDATEDDRAALFGKMAKAVAIAKHLGAKYMAVHPLMPYGVNKPDDPEGVYEINKRYYKALADVAGKLGVTVCLENMPHPNFPLAPTESILNLIEDIGSPHLKFCFDVGHANVIGESISGSVRAAGKNLKIIHVHDNMGNNDSHLPPYDGSVDFGEFVEALYDIGFDGVMNLETSPQKLPGFDSMTPEQITEKELELAKIAKLLAGY